MKIQIKSYKTIVRWILGYTWYIPWVICWAGLRLFNFLFAMCDKVFDKIVRIG
jgi:hypothetical protein